MGMLCVEGLELGEHLRDGLFESEEAVGGPGMEGRIPTVTGGVNSLSVGFELAAELGKCGLQEPDLGLGNEYAFELLILDPLADGFSLL